MNSPDIQRMKSFQKMCDNATRMPTRQEMRAFNQGELAHGRGATIDANPYPKWDENRLPHALYCMWDSGWISADTQPQ